MDGTATRDASGQPPTLDHRALDPEQARRLRRARRTAMIAGAVAVSFFVLSIVQLLWIQHMGLH
jgi:hypothetical protein